MKYGAEKRIDEHLSRMEAAGLTGYAYEWDLFKEAIQDLKDESSSHKKEKVALRAKLKSKTEIARVLRYKLRAIK